VEEGEQRIQDVGQALSAHVRKEPEFDNSEKNYFKNIC
jgi:hypothetical protein